MELDNETWAMVGGAVAAFLAGLFGYLRKPKKPDNDSVIAGVGFELGNRMQMDQLIAAQLQVAAAVNRVADVLADKKQDEVTDGIQEILQRLDKPRR